MVSFVAQTTPAHLRPQPIDLEVIVHVGCEKYHLHQRPQIHEAVCISNPDGYAKKLT